MRWEERLFDLFDDLEQQAEGLALIGRDAEVAELSRAEYAQVDFAARLHASAGRSVRFGVNGLGLIEARLARVGEGWCLLADGPTEWLVRTPAIRSARGLSQHGRTAMARPLTARLGLTSALRRPGQRWSCTIWTPHRSAVCSVGSARTSWNSQSETMPLRPPRWVTSRWCRSGVSRPCVPRRGEELAVQLDASSGMVPRRALASD